MLAHMHTHTTHTQHTHNTHTTHTQHTHNTHTQHTHTHLLCQFNQYKSKQNVHKTCTKSEVQSKTKAWIASYLLIYNPIQYKKPNQCV